MFLVFTAFTGRRFLPFFPTPSPPTFPKPIWRRIPRWWRIYVRELQNACTAGYQIISTIPNQLLLKARQENPVNKEFFTSNNYCFYLNNNLGINLDKAKSCDFYQLLLDKTHTARHTGPKRWSEILSLNDDHWDKIFKSLRTICRETKLREFQFKFIHRTVVTKGELFKYGIKLDDECCFCGGKDSIQEYSTRKFPELLRFRPK